MRINLSAYRASRLFFLIYLLYAQVFTYFYSNIYLEIVLITLAMFFQLREDKFRLSGGSYLWLFAFALYTLITSSIVAVNSQRAFTFIFVFIEYIFVFYLIHRYTIVDGNIRFSTNSFIILAFAMALFNLLYGGNQVRLSFSEELNSNAVGVVCMFGIAYLLYQFINMKKNYRSIIVVLSLLLIFAFVVIRTVSRKAILGSAAILIFWVLFCYRQSFSRRNVLLRILLFLLLMTATYLAVRWFFDKYADTVNYLAYRFSRLNANDNGSTAERLYLIDRGFEVFKEHFLLGVGFNNFRYYNSYNTYAHNFYIELLSCTGVFGAILFSIPLFRSLNQYIAVFIKAHRSSNEDKTEIAYMFFVFIVFLALSWTQIIFYGLTLMYAFGVLAAFAESNSGLMLNHNNI